jgi:hypothetical protein
VRLYSLDTPSAPARLGDVCARGQVQFAQFDRGLLFVQTYNEDGIAVFDVSDPLAPVELGFRHVDGVHGFAAAGNLVCAGSYRGSVVFLDVSDPAAPAEVSSFSTGGRAAHCVLANGLAYATVWDRGVVILDVSDPVHPRDVGGIADPSIWYFEAKGALGVLGRWDSTRLDVFTLSTPSAPVLAGTLITPEPGIAIDIQLEGALAYVVGEGFWKGLGVVDVSDPAHPTLRGQVIATAAGGTFDLFGSTGFMSGWTEGTHVLDLSAPDQPQAVARLDTPGVYWDVALAGDLAVVANDFDGLMTLTGAGSGALTEVGREHVLGTYLSVDVKDGHALVAAEFEDLRIYALHDQAPPVEVATVPTGGIATRVVVDGSRALVAGGAAGVHVADVARADAPVDLGAVDTPGLANDVTVLANVAYVADGTGGVRAIDLAGFPAAIGGFPTPGLARGIAVFEGQLLVSEEQCLRLYLPGGQPTAASCDANAHYDKVVVRDRHAFVADRQRSSIDLFELGTSIVRTGRAVLPGSPDGMTLAADGTIWVAADDAGLMILRKASFEAPPAGPWLSSAQVPGFRVKARIDTGAAISEQVPACIAETLCVSGAVPGRAEVFVRVVGPRPNGKLWPTIVKFTTSRVQLWIEQIATGVVRYYDLAAVDPAGQPLSLDGLTDKGGFDPPGSPSFPLESPALGALADAWAPPAAELDPTPPGGPWLETAEVPAFRFKVRVAGSLLGQRVSACIAETLCVSGAVAGRPEVFVRVVGPRPNGKLWPTIVKFTTSRVEVWIEQKATGARRYYDLAPVAPGDQRLILDGLADKLGFDP